MLEVIVPKRVFFAQLQAAAAVTERKSPTPMASSVCLSTSEGKLVLTGTDLYRSVTCGVGGDGVQTLTQGSAALPAKDLLERIKAMPDGPIQIHITADYRATVRAVGAPRRFVLSGTPSEEFPHLPTRGDALPLFTLPGAVLADLIGRVSFAVSDDETRPHVNSALFEISQGRLRLVATDGHRAVCADRAAPIAGKGTVHYLIPLKGLGDVKALAAGAEGDITMTVAGKDAFFETGGVTLSVRLVTEPFPPYQQVMARPTSARALTAKRAEVLDRVNAVAVAAEGKGRGVKLRAEKDRLFFTAESAESGNAHDELEVTYDGPPISVGMNAGYLIDALKGMEPAKGIVGDEVTLWLAGELDPIHAAPAVETDVTIVNVLMPMRI